MPTCCSYFCPYSAYNAFFACFLAQGKHAKGRQYMCHSAHVTNVRFSHADQKLVSVGGADTAVVVWDYGGGSQEDSAVRGEESDTDSEEEGVLIRVERGGRHWGGRVSRFFRG